MSNAPSSLAEAITLHRAGRLADAETIYRQILAARPDDLDSLHLLGVIFLQRGQHADAIRQLDCVLARHPGNAVVLNNRGNALNGMRRFEEALASYDRALAEQPDHAEVHSNRGATLHRLQRFEEAVASYDRALTVQPHYAEAHSNRGNSLRALGRYEEALASHDRAIAARPNYAQAHSNRGNSLHALGRYEEALASYDRALAIRPDYVEAYSNRANTLQALGRYDDALASCERAIALQPNHAEAYSNRGNALQELARFVDALASYKHALALRPDYADAHNNAALCRLLTGDFARGWQEYEWRWETELGRIGKRNFAQKLWTGSDEVAGKTILLHAEQGLGDTIQFCRYAPRVAERGAHVILEVEEPLRTLMSTLSAAVQIVSRGDPLPDFDLHCPLLSLPRAFGTQLATVPSETPYLCAAEDKIEAWRDRLGPHIKRRVGLVWAGNPRRQFSDLHRVDRSRSIELERLAVILQVPGCEFYSLQKGDDAVAQLRNGALRHRIVDWTNDLHDFSDTAALIENLDLVISVDTAVVHLAGALGKPVWLINRYNSCWRWLLDREDSPWYPTARLFRQDHTRDWDTVIARVEAALHDYVRAA